MFLGASEPDADLEAAISDDPDADAGIAHGRPLRRFARAVLGPDAGELSEARADLGRLLGPDGLADAAAVVAMFDSINRVADATGTKLEDDYSATADLTRKRFDALGFDVSDRAFTPPGTG
jgi:hypothetical protein